jgi:HAD superfamily hydrolase (TIGR01459 family)
MAAVAERYDGFLLDQWGVLHDGTTPYPGAVQCLERLRATGKTIIILSNSGRRGRENEAVLARMGFDRGLYHHIVSAGDDAHEALLRRDDPAYRDLGERCLLIARAGEEYLADGLGLTVTADPDEADFILNLTFDPERQPVSGWSAILERGAARGIPMICGNPDRYRVHASGRLYEAPGLLAFAYEKLGGPVHYHGKPYPRIYRSCFRIMGLPPDRVLGVGDSLAHDVAGAANAGIDACFIAGGIHKDDLGWSNDLSPEPESCLALFAGERQHPRYCLPSFRW